MVRPLVPSDRARSVSDGFLCPSLTLRALSQAFWRKAARLASRKRSRCPRGVGRDTLTPISLPLTMEPSLMRRLLLAVLLASSVVLAKDDLGLPPGVKDTQ